MKSWPMAVALALAFLVGWMVNGWRVGLQLEAAQAAHDRTRAEYQAKLAESLQAAQAERERLEAQTQEALHERDQEIERLRVAASRIPDTIRVRVPAPCPVSPAPGGVPDPAPGGDPPGGVLSPGVGEGDRVLEVRRVTELMREADELAATMRAVVRACRP